MKETYTREEVTKILLNLRRRFEDYHDAFHEESKKDKSYESRYLGISRAYKNAIKIVNEEIFE